MPKANKSHDLSFLKQDASTEIGLMLAKDTKDVPMYGKFDDPSLAQQFFSGTPGYANLPPEKEIQMAQDDWRAGMGQEIYDDTDLRRYYDAHNMDLRFKGQAVSGPATLSLTQPSGVTRAFAEFSDGLYAGIDNKLCKLGASSTTMTLRPNAAGSETSIDYQYPDSTSHYDKVDDATADDISTYIKTSSDIYQRDLYNLPASGGSGVINYITIYFRCNGPSATYAKPSLKSNSTVTDGTEVSLTSSWTTYSQSWATNPADGAAWEWTDIDALEIGVSLSHRSESGFAYSTQVYVEIDYTATTDEIGLVHTFAATVGADTFVGTGLNDLTAAGTFTGSVPVDYKVEIDGVGTPNTFRWSDDGGTTWDASTVNITGTAQTLNNGVTITFGATTGHTATEYWTFTCNPSANITDLEAFTDGNLYIALGNAARYNYMDTGENFTISTLDDGQADYFQTVNTNLWKACKPREMKSAVSGDPTNAGDWSAATNVGSTAEDITCLLEESGNLYVMKEDMPYYIDTDGAVHRLIPELKSMETSTSGANSDVWQAKVYIPCGAQGLVEYDGGTVSWRSPATFFTCSINTTDYIGRVMATTHDEEYLFTVTQSISGAGSTPKVFAGRLETIDSTTQWVWHPIASPTLGSTGICQTAFVSAVYKKRLYLASTYPTTSLEYIPLPTTYSNIDADPDYTTVSGGYFLTPLHHANFKADSKAYIKLTLGLDNVDASNYFTAYYQLRGTITWTSIGDFKTEPTTTKYIPVDASSNNPSGTMIRFKFVSVIADTSTSPRLLSYDCRGIWYPTRREIITARVLCADNLTMKNGGTDSQTASTIKTAVDEMNAATWPVTFYDLDGETVYVKLLSKKEYITEVGKERNAERVYDLTFLKVTLA